MRRASRAKRPPNSGGLFGLRAAFAEISARCDRCGFPRGALHAGGHLVCHGALLFDRGRGRSDILANIVDRLLDHAERTDDVAGDEVEVADLLADLVGFLLALSGKALDLGGDARKTPARLARAG